MDGLANLVDEARVLVGHGVADGVWNIEGGGTGIDGCLKDFTEKIGIGAGCVLGRELDVVAERTGVGNTLASGSQCFLAGDFELEGEMNVTGGEESVDARARGSLERLGSDFNVVADTASKGGNAGSANFTGDAMHGFEVTTGGDGKARLDNVHAETLKLVSHG